MSFFLLPSLKNVGPVWLQAKLSFAGIDFLHESASSARQLVMFGHPVTIAVFGLFNWPTYVTPAATQYPAVVRVQAASSSSRGAEVGWTVGVHKCVPGHLALWTSLAWRAVFIDFELRLIINGNSLVLGYRNHRFVHWSSVQSAYKGC
jgi:hypothetical protein